MGRLLGMSALVSNLKNKRNVFTVMLTALCLLLLSQTPGLPTPTQTIGRHITVQLVGDSISRPLVHNASYLYDALGSKGLDF